MKELDNNARAPTRGERLETALFEASSDYGAREVTLPAKFPFAQGIEPLFEGNLVSQPLSIAKEGTYIKLAEVGGKVVARKVKITRKDLELMAQNVTRDVPLNSEHMKWGPNYFGWVRSKTLPMTVDKDEDGRVALFAQVEVTRETLDLIERGRYRDFSPELDLLQKRLRGLALTNYPVMQEIHQFSEGTVDDNPEVVEEDFQEETVDIEAIKKELRDELRSTVEAEFSEQISTLRSELDAEKEARSQAEREARTQRLSLEFSERIKKLIKDEDGNARLLPGATEPLLQLYCFAAQHEDATFDFSEGEETKSLNPVELLDAVFSHLPKAEMFGQTVVEGKAGEEPEEFSDDSENGIDVAAISAAARSIIGGS